MRVLIPERINKLAKAIEPYMEFDKERGGYYLIPDAPPEIVEMQKEFHKWMQEHKCRK